MVSRYLLLAWLDPGDPVGPRAVETAAGTPLTGLPGLGLLSSGSTTFQPAATVGLGKVALWAPLQEGLRSSPDKPAFTTEASAGWA